METKKLLNADNAQQGFTLIELMISLTLGLLISAAILQVFYVSSRTSSIQSSGSDIIDANVFGLQRLERNIKLTGLGTSDVTSNTVFGSGILFDASTNLLGVQLDSNQDVGATLLTRGQDDTAGTGNEWTGISHTDNTSDQLTIQYRAAQDTFDCEGQTALGPRTVTVNGESKIIDGQIIIERYFVREADDTLVLACDAGRYITETMDNYADQGDSSTPITVFTKANSIKEFGDAGAVIISNIDDFQVLLGVKTTDGIVYISSTDYVDTNKTFGGLPVVSVKLGIIARGNQSLPGGNEGKLTFDLLGLSNTTINDDEPKNIIRKKYESNVMLRNSRVL